MKTFQELLLETRSESERLSGSPCEAVVRAPGRVNLIGEHTDYNQGFVLPMAIDRWTTIALRPVSGNVVRIHSLDFGESASFSLEELDVEEVPGWIRYARGMASAMAEHGLALCGWEGVMASNVPIGAGLSSSASMELAVARAFCQVSSWKWDPKLMAQLAQRAENRWVGVNCGIMDQLISACGVEGQALLVDCRDLSTRPVAVPQGCRIVVLDTNKRRTLGDSAYNERRAQCQQAAQICGASSLRDVSESLLLEREPKMPPVVFRRGRHVLSENARTLDAASAMDAGDAVRLGKLMDGSHISLQEDFEVSCAELDAMVEGARQQPGCLGARMTGGGFGGCALALVEEARIEAFVPATSAAYRSRTGLEPALYLCRAVAGAEQVR